MRHFKKLSLSIVLLLAYNMCMQGMWQPPVLISSQYDDSLIAKLAFNAGGTGFAVWPQATGLYVNLTPFPVFLSNYNPNTQSWTSLDALNQLGQSNYADGDPTIALDANGNGLVVWARGTGEFSNNNIVAINYVNGVFSPVNSPVVLSQPYSVAPQLAMSPDGDAIVTWVVANIDTYSCYIQAAYYSGTSHDWVRINGLPLVKTIRDNVQFLDPYLPFPQVGIGPVGVGGDHKALFVWAQLGFDGVAYTSTVWSLTYDGSGWVNWTPPVPEQLSIANGYDPVLAMNTSGDATVVWAETSITLYPETQPFSILAARYDGSHQDYIRNVSDDIFVQDLQDNVDPYSGLPRAQVAIDPQGDSFITWDNANLNAGYGGIEVAQYSFAISWTSWNPADLLVMVSQGYPFVLLPTVAMDLNGNAMVLWMTYIEPYGNLVLQAAAYDQLSASWGDPTYIMTDATHDIDYYVTENDWPNLTYDPSGNVYASWAQSDGRVARANIAQYQPGVIVRSAATVSEKKRDVTISPARSAQVRARLAFLQEKKGAHKKRPHGLANQKQKNDFQCKNMSKGIL